MIWLSSIAQKWTFMKIPDYFNVLEKTIMPDQKKLFRNFQSFCLELSAWKKWLDNCPFIDGLLIA